jgi:hypothetical protein
MTRDHGSQELPVRDARLLPDQPVESHQGDRGGETAPPIDREPRIIDRLYGEVCVLRLSRCRRNGAGSRPFA